MKRTIAVLLSIIMCIGAMAFAIPAGAETEYNLFSDATYTYTLSDGIDFWTNGCTDTGRTCLTDGAFRRTSGNVAFNDIYGVAGTTVELPGTWVSGPICSPWVVIIILAREFLVTSARMIYAERGTVIAANIWGKLKTVFQLTAIITIFILMYGLELLSMFNVNLPIIADIVGVVFVVLTWLSALITVISGGTYLYQCRDLLKDAK